MPALGARRETWRHAMRMRWILVLTVACAVGIAACGSSNKASGPGSGGQAVPRTAPGVALATCMRAHGVPHFPDPSASPPASLSGYSAVIRRGVYLAIPDTINMASPTYRRAAAACRFGPRFS